MKAPILPAALTAAIAGLLACMPAGEAMPLVAPFHVPATDAAGTGGLVRVHGTHAPPVHCHMAWSTSRGWHAHWRHCDLPRFNPRWRDPRHWHWRERSRWRGILHRERRDEGRSYKH